MKNNLVFYYIYMFFKKYYKKNVPKKYRKLGKQINSSPSLGQLVKRINYVKSLLNVEYKVFDSALHTFINQPVQNISTIGVLNNMLSIPQGVGESFRIGNSIKVKRIFLRYILTANGQSSVPQNVRVMLFRDTNRDVAANGSPVAIVTLGNVIKPDNPTTGQIDNICAPINDATSGRYTMLMNKMITLDRSARAGTTIEKYFKLNQDVKFPVDSVNNPINTYFLVFMTDSVTNPPTVTGTARITYIDN